MSSVLKDISVQSYEEIFGLRSDDEKDKVTEVPLSELHTFKKHPFHVRDDDAMRELAASVKERGVLAHDDELTASAVAAALASKENRHETLMLRLEHAEGYFPQEYTKEQMLEVILELLEGWRRRNEHA